MRKPRHKTATYLLQGGPYHGEKLRCSSDAVCTLEFSVNCFKGFYVLSSCSGKWTSTLNTAESKEVTA